MCVNNWWWKQTYRPRSWFGHEPYNIAAIFSSCLRADGLETHGQEPGMFENRSNENLFTSLSLLRWNKLKEKTWNSKIDWNNCCENNCHRNMRGQLGHILPVMNSKYMWCIRVTLMAQLCHEKIQACTHGTGTLCCKTGNRKHLPSKHNIKMSLSWYFKYFLCYLDSRFLSFSSYLPKLPFPV